MKDNTRIKILGWMNILACALGIYDYSLLKTARAKNENLKQELATVKQDSMADILKLLKDRNDIIISVKHYTHDWDYVLCVDFKRETYPSDLYCDFEIDSGGNKDLMELKAKRLKQQLIGE